MELLVGGCEAAAAAHGEACELDGILEISGGLEGVNECLIEFEESFICKSWSGRNEVGDRSGVVAEDFVEGADMTAECELGFDGVGDHEVCTGDCISHDLFRLGWERIGRSLQCAGVAVGELDSLCGVPGKDHVCGVEEFRGVLVALLCERVCADDGTEWSGEIEVDAGILPDACSDPLGFRHA